MRDVCFSCDDNGVRFLKVAVYSLLKHYRGTEPIRINILDGFGGHSESNRAALRELVSRFPNASVRHIDSEPAVEPYKDLILNRAHSRWNIFTWTPIFEPFLVSDATGNLIHLDIDTCVNADISPLFELDLGDNLIAAVHEYDRTSARGKVESVIWDKGILPPTVERYFNTGVLVFNTAKCRAEQTAAHIIDWYRAHYDIADRIEQDAWNALYWDRTVPLPIAWNFHDRAIKRYVKADRAAKYWAGNAPKDCLAAALAPKILHFWGPKKPWKKSHRPYRGIYHAMMREVGLEPPPEPLFAWWYDLVNRRHLRRIATRLAKLETRN